MTVWEKQDNRASGLVDEEMMQSLQDHFCASNGMYVFCLGTEEGLITQCYGEQKEQDYFRERIGHEIYLSLIHKIQSNTIEQMIEAELPQKELKLCAISTRLEGKTQIIWVIAAIIEEELNEENRPPKYMLTTTRHRFLRSVEFLESLSRLIFAVKMDELIAQEAMQKSIASEERMQKQLHRSETIGQILSMLESENGFGKIVDDILKITCDGLGISCGALIRKDKESGALDMVCEYAQQEKWQRLDKFQHVPEEKIPFFTGKQYVLSSDSMLSDEFKAFFQRYGITAGVFQPVEISGKSLMYLAFYEKDQERNWEIDDIKFLSDVKRIVQSILTKRLAKNSLASSYASLEEILENVGCGIYVLGSGQEKPLYTNRKFKKLLSHSIASGKVNQILFSDQESVDGNFFNEVYSAEEQRWFDIYRTSINWVDGREVNLCTVYDITDKKKYQKKIESQANNDFLTGLYNRMRCEHDLAHCIRATQSTGKEGALIYIDLDDFKNINDGLGHKYGDVLLKAISYSLRNIKGIENCCYRMGGDEFIVIVTEENYENLEKISLQIQDIFTRPWLLKGEYYYCTISMGIVRFPTDGRTVEEVIRKADIALFSAKKDGKNRIEYYSGNEGTSSYRRLDMEKNMRKATLEECKEFEVYYQPIVNVEKEGNPCYGAEALVRWNSAELGFVSPVDFIPLAEYLGLINPIGDHVLSEAAKRCRYWNDMGHPDYRVNVNLSVVQLLQNDIVKKVQKVLNETRINPKNLTLEVTESLAINDMERMKDVLGQIKALGVRVALDDFGTGYSSLNHIREMPIDVIKIDRCFVEHIAEDDFSDAFVKMVAELAATIGVKICVEGVETQDQYDILSKMRIGMIQGYLFGKPMQIAEFEQKYL